jgi:protein TonB
MSKQSRDHRRWLRLSLMGLAAAGLLGLLVWLMASLMDNKPVRQKQPPKISLLPDKPPPPPPPPKEEKKPEPPKAEQKEIKTEPPREPMPQAQNEPLKMEGAAGDGPSPFAAGAVNREYVGGTVGGRLGQSLFADRLQRHLSAELNRNRKLRERDYRVQVRLWLERDGSIQKAELAQSTGDAALDELLRQALLEARAMSEAPPENMPQPIRIRVTARGAS